ncbi:MAG: RRXRR domain-containing protein [Candidatus Heimdallarchaeaceae archaeon]
MPRKRVSVVGKDETPLTPCTPAKARKLIKGGVAKKKWSKLGIFYIQMLVDTRKETPKMCLGIDPGSKFDGYAVVSEKEIQQTGMAILPKMVRKKNKNRREMRKARRFRKTWRRPCRFDNRKRPDRRIAPSQKAKVDFRLRITEELCKIYPITQFAVEDVKFNHYRKRWGKFFSTVEIGKTKLYEALSKLGEVRKYIGVETSELREKLGLKKTTRKSELIPEAHATDAAAIAMDMIGCKNFGFPSFFAWKRYEFYRRQLHKREPSKGRAREKYGGSILTKKLKKGDVVSGIYKRKRVMGLACSYSRGYIGIATFKKSQRWIVPEHTIERYYSNLIQNMEVAIHPPAIAGGLLAR